MDICLDTNVFSSDRDFFVWMNEHDVKGYVSSLVVMEISYHEMKKAGGSALKFIYMLNSMDIDVIPFDRSLALLAANKALPGHDFSNNAVDYAIGAYAFKRKMPMVTNNKKHFKWVGEVYTPAEFMQKY